MLKYSHIFFITLLILGGCSGVVYVPEDEYFKSKKVSVKYLDATIVTAGFDEVKLSNGKIFDIFNREVSPPEIHFDDEVVSAESKKHKLIAYVSEKNEIKVFSLEQNKTIFSAPFQPENTFDARLPKPVFDKDSIMFFTLDGSVIIYLISENKIVRSFSLKSKDYSNNVIAYKLAKDYLLVANSNEVFIIQENFQDKLEANIRGLIFDDKDENIFYLLTKDGEIRKYNTNFKLLKKVKFPFAHFVAFGETHGEIYLLESQGYLIKMDLNLEHRSIVDAEIYQENCFFTKERFICDELTFKLPLSF